MQLTRIRLVIILLLIIAGILTLFASRLINRWYGQIIGDTFQIQSIKLSNFRADPTFLKAFIVLPISSKEDLNKRFPVIYHLHGFGADYEDAAYSASKLRSNMRKYPETELIHVYLDASLGDGYHYFVNSENTGPWESALVEEFIPEFEKNFPVISSPSARFITGHSSGAWSSLWLQINHPDFFGGAWSVSPDPIDFRDFFGISIAENSEDNFYKDKDGHSRKVARSGKLNKVTIQDYVRQDEEDADHPCDSDFGSYECAFSPKTQNGPMLLFDRKSGLISKDTAIAWEKFDIGRVLKTNLENLRPKLDRKLHLFCGARDDFFLDGPFKKFCALLKEGGLQSSCDLVEGRGHGDIYLPTKASPQGLAFRIEKEARQIYQNSLSNGDL